MGQLKDKNGNNYNPTTTTNDVTDGTQTLEQRLQSIEESVGGEELTDDWVESTLTLASADHYLGNASKDSILNPVGTSNSSYNIYSADVVEYEKVKIIASASTGSFGLIVFCDKKGVVSANAVTAGYSGNVLLTKELVVPPGAVKVYISENKNANGVGSTKLYRKILTGEAMAAYNEAVATQMRITDTEMIQYYDLGAQRMDTYNLIPEKVGIITIGQSNADNRIAAADYPASATINGSTIALSKSVPTCKLIQGSTESTYDNNTKSFAALNNTGAWSFDQVLYNAVANALGSETDFYVCKQTRGNTSLKYQYPTSFWADVDDFKFNSGYYSQLYHLKMLVERALTLQPDIKFKAIIMHQGEGDGGTLNEGQYYMALCKMIQWIRGLVGSPKLPFIFGSIPTNSISFSQIIYDDMQRAATDLNDVYLVTMGEATDWVDDQWHSGTNGLHFGANTAVKLADDMYKLMVNNKMFKI